METSIYAPGGPGRLDDNDLSAVKSQYGLHSYDNDPDTTPVSWLSEKEVLDITSKGVFCFTRDGEHFAGIVTTDEIVYISIDYCEDDVRRTDELLNTYKSLTNEMMGSFLTHTMLLKRMTQGTADGLCGLHVANGNEYRRWLEAAKLYLRCFAVNRNYNLSKVFRLARKPNWKSTVAKGSRRGERMSKGMQREELFIIFLVQELDKIGTLPSVILPSYPESIINANTTTMNEKTTTVKDLELQIANLEQNSKLLASNIEKLRNDQVEIENRMPLPPNPLRQLNHADIKKPLTKRIKNIAHDTDLADENIFAFRRGSYEGVLCLRNFNGELGFWFAFNLNNDGMTVEYEEGKDGNLVENMILRYPNTAERYLGQALKDQLKQKIAAYKSAFVSEYQRAVEEIEAQRKVRYDEIEAEIEKLVEKKSALDARIAELQEKVRIEASKVELVSLDVDFNAGPPIIVADDNVSVYADSDYNQTNAQRDETDNYDQATIEALAEESGNYTNVIDVMQHLPFIHYIRGKRFRYSDNWPFIRDDDFEWEPDIMSSELKKLIQGMRPLNTHATYITRQYLTYMAERSAARMSRSNSPLSVVPKGERMQGSIILPTDGKGGNHIYIYDIRNDIELCKFRIAHMYGDELLGTINFQYKGIYQKPYDASLYAKSEHIQSDMNDASWKGNQASLDMSIVTAFLAAEIDSMAIIKNELSAGRGEETVTALKHGDFPNDIEIRDASWYTSIFVDKEIPVKGHVRRYWCGSGADRHLEVRTIMPHIRSGYHREAKVLQ